MEETVHLLIMYTMLVLTVLLFHKGRKHPQSMILAVYASVEVLTNGLNSFTLTAGYDFFIRFPFIHFIYKPIYCLWAPLFYFYFKYSASNDFRIGKKHWPHFLVFIVFIFSFLLILILEGNSYIRENLYLKNSYLYFASFSIDFIVRIQYLIYNYLMIRTLLKIEKQRKLEKVDVRQNTVDIFWLRFIVYGYAVGCISGIILFVSVLLNSAATPMINIISISYFFLFFFVIFYNTITHKISIDEAIPKSRLQPDIDMQQLMKRIDELVVGRQKYLESELNLQQIANLLNEKERNISQAINTIQQRNLNDYINSLRIEHACNLLIGKEEKPIYEIMYESGFSTKGAFNLAFKRVTGKTPTEFKKDQREYKISKQ